MTRTHTHSTMRAHARRAAPHPRPAARRPRAPHAIADQPPRHVQVFPWWAWVATPLLTVGIVFGLLQVL
ncbi:hypothetical protein [Curtobacterium sp. PhB115]|uniref:hypothetical protein n=1 Tax=Curtobacterium sp. PhB115 TaxID=2485173 RepID=UPI0011CE1836|nr:hypothetical protein [Curtobacterium sp. PhB115]